MRRRAARLICIVVAAAFQLLQPSSARSAPEVRRVLVINDLSIVSSPGFAEIVQAILTGLQKSPYRIEIYEESLDLTLFPDRVSQDSFREEIIQKYSTRKPDVIIAAGPVSLKFIAKLYDKFLRAPTIFCTIWGGIPDEVRQGMPFTGVLAQLDAEGTLNAALRLLPSTKHVVVVGGVGKFDQGFEAIAKQSFRNYESKLEFTYLFDLTMPALLERLKHLPNDTIVYHTAMSQDAAGDRFVDSAQSIPMVADAANAPVFVMDDVDLRAGTVGGDLVNWTDDGRIAAEMAVRVLNGEKPQDIPIAKSTNEYMFDSRALKRWGLKESNLPPGSIVLNRHLTVWESYKWSVISGISLILLEALLIGGLLWQRSELRKSEKAVRESEERFRLVANTAPVMIWMSGSDRKCSYVNKTWLDFSGRPAEAEIGDDWAGGLHPDDVDRSLQIYTEAFDRRESFETQYRLRRHDGEYRWVLDKGAPRFNPDHTFAGYIGSCIDITDRKLAEETMSTMGRRLIEAHEEERTWIGRELHDDINQRLALVAAELDRLGQRIPPSSEFIAQVLNAQRGITQIAKDVQNLSHRLHSSKLEYLGLATAAKSFCREMSEQNKVEVQFTQSGIPRSLPKEISLCLFRVLQEALQNAVKHSGVRSFTVDLYGTEEAIELTVEDTGGGFEEQEAFTRSGLGLISMRERLQMVRGEFEVKSKPGAGTKIYARVPIITQSYRAVAS